MTYTKEQILSYFVDVMGYSEDEYDHLPVKDLFEMIEDREDFIKYSA